MKKILIIDDEEMIQENISDYLREKGFDTYKAADGVQGIEAALDILPDLILCDINMPKKDGFEVCKTLQSIESTCNIPFIFLSAKSHITDLRRGMLLGADDFVSKPFEYDVLLRTIKVRLEKFERKNRLIDEKILSVVDNPLTGVFIYQENKFAFSNSRISEMLGYSQEEMKNLSFEDIVIASDNTRGALESIRSCIQGKIISVHTELLIQKKDFSHITMELYGTRMIINDCESFFGNLQQSDINNKELYLGGIYVLKQILSKREIEILQQLCKGYTTVEMAKRMEISRRTAETHKQNIFKKTGAKNTADLVMFAVRNGLVKL